MTESSSQRIDDTPGSAGSVTEASDAAAEHNPAEQAGGVAESLPAAGPDPADRLSGGDERPRDESREHGRGGRDPEIARGAGVPDKGGAYVDEFRPEPVPQVPSKGRVGQEVGGAQVIPD